jgi:GTP1/Obg family GTP-binding protein
VIAIITSLRRRPPLAEEMAKKYATKSELRDAMMAIHNRIESQSNGVAELKADFNARFSALSQQFHTDLSSISVDIKNMERCIGQLEGLITK